MHRQEVPERLAQLVGWRGPRQDLVHLAGEALDQDAASYGGAKAKTRGGGRGRGHDRTPAQVRVQ